MMIPRKSLMGAVGLSLAVHVAILFAFALITYAVMEDRPKFLVESVFSEEREQEEFSQELEVDPTVSENLSMVAGGSVTGAVGAATGPVVSQTRIETSESLKEPVLVANVGAITIPGESMLGQDLGEKAVMGETGAVVEGYGAAMSRITREILRLMRESKVEVVWLFDESESMKDDQVEIRDQFHKVYEELGIAAKQEAAEGAKGRRSKGPRVQDEVLLTAVASYGEGLHYLLETPTADVPAVQAAIDKIPVDETGKENMCKAIQEVVKKYRVMAGRQDRRLAIVIVSDESGDDGQFVEEALQEAKRANAPIYIMGREAVFGYPYARMRIIDKQYGLAHWLNVNRGPETAYVEALQWNGFDRRHDVYQSGFGPYDQVRLAKETGGVYFLLPGEEENLSGPGANDRRKFDFLDMKEYQPGLESRREYEEARARSPKFRAKIWEVINFLNPYEQKELSVQQWNYSIDPEQFARQAQTNFQKAGLGLARANQAAALLDSIAPQREREEAHRWRAAYDLMRAQTFAYRVRLWQYMLALDAHVKAAPKPKNPKNNAWDIGYRKELLPPDPVQVKLTKIDLKEIEAQMKKATELYQFVIAEHPGTPWSRRAQDEINRGFGIDFHEVFRDPNYDRLDIKLPKL